MLSCVCINDFRYRHNVAWVSSELSFWNSNWWFYYSNVFLDVSYEGLNRFLVWNVLALSQDTFHKLFEWNENADVTVKVALTREPVGNWRNFCQGEMIECQLIWLYGAEIPRWGHKDQVRWVLGTPSCFSHRSVWSFDISRGCFYRMRAFTTKWKFCLIDKLTVTWPVENITKYYFHCQNELWNMCSTHRLVLLSVLRPVMFSLYTHSRALLYITWCCIPIPK